MDGLDLPLSAISSVYGGSVVYPPGGRFGPRIQQDIQLVMLYSGEMKVSIDGRELHVKPGHVALLKPGREETFVFSDREETWHRWIAVHAPSLTSESIAFLNELPEYVPLTESINRITDLAINLTREGLTNSPALLSLGLAALQLYPANATRKTQDQEKHPAVYAALAHIRDRYSEDLTLRELASEAGVSPEHLVRLFKHQVEATPIQYLWEYRLERAKELLTNTGLNVNQIAERCGYKTSNHFSRHVKSATGRTASELRRLSWGGLREKS